MNRALASLSAFLLATLLGTTQLHARAAHSQVLARVGDQSITAGQLESAIASSPFAVPFNTMNEDDQAAFRGSLLQRLVASRLLYLEAQRQGLEQSDVFRKELDEFRTGLLYRSYMDRLRSGIRIPDEVRAEMRQQFAGHADALKAAEAAYQVDRFRIARQADLKRLRARYQVHVHEEAIRTDAAPETVLLEGDGLRITYADLLTGSDTPQPGLEWIRDRLSQRAELLLVTRAAAEQGLDLGERLATFHNERLPALLLEQQEREWIPNEQVLKDYFQAHPELGRVLERRHIGQLVLATGEEAQAMRRRILAGESLFALAGQYSIDPYGREHKGDMGWVKADQGMPQIEAAIAGLADGALSEVIQTPLGFHLVTILERSPGEQRPFPKVEDKVRQAYVMERMVDYLDRLGQRYPVVWQVLDQQVSQSGAQGSRPN